MQTDDQECVFFSPTEVIIDNAASLSLFQNMELLRDIVQSDTITVIGGVQKGATGMPNGRHGKTRPMRHH